MAMLCHRGHLQSQEVHHLGNRLLGSVVEETNAFQDSITCFNNQVVLRIVAGRVLQFVAEAVSDRPVYYIHRLPKEVDQLLPQAFRIMLMPRLQRRVELTSSLVGQLGIPQLTRTITLSALETGEEARRRKSLLQTLEDLVVMSRMSAIP